LTGWVKDFFEYIITVTNMSTQTSQAIMTADELLERSSELGRCELIRGELIKMSPAGYDHGKITNTLAYHLTAYAIKHDLGHVLSAETGFVLERNPDTVREADVPFVCTDRLPKGPAPGFFEGAPDLAIEVLSPSARASEVAQKVDLWLRSGTQLVWVVDPARQTVTIHRDPTRSETIHTDGKLDGEKVLPGFKLPVRDIFNR